MSNTHIPNNPPCEHAEFAINNSVNRSTGCTPFEAVYGRRPYTPMDLTPLPLPPRPSEAGLDFSKHMKCSCC